jgi:flagellar basal body-associated protein FliL
MLKILGVVFGALSLVTSGFVLYQSLSAVNQLAAHPVSAHPEEGQGGETEAKNEHGESQAKASTEEAHGGSASHGEEKKNGEHGGGHGESASRETASVPSMIPFVSLEEVFANVPENSESRTLAVKIDVELFDNSGRDTFKSGQAIVRHLILQASREQKYDELATLSGKLYFKELLIRRMNGYFKKPLVKDVHFASFFLQ